MLTLEYRTMDKSGWGNGSWQSEPDKRQWLDDRTGLPCLIVRSALGSLCGYVGVYRDHPAYGVDYNDVPVDVHGGLTFAARCSRGDESKAVCHKVEPDDDDEVWWLGFDCAHYGDRCPSSKHALLDDGEYRDFAYVTGEVEHLAQQLDEMQREASNGS